MCDAFSMAILQSCQYLTKYSSCFLLFKLLVNHLFKVWMETASWNILHYQINMRICFEGFNQFHNVRMVHLLQQHNFSSYAPLPIDVRQFSFIVYFDSIFLIVFSWRCHSYNCISSLSNLSSKYIVMNSVSALRSSIIVVTYLRRIIGRVVINEDEIVIALT